MQTKKVIFALCGIAVVIGIGAFALTNQGALFQGMATLPTSNTPNNDPKNTDIAQNTPVVKQQTPVAKDTAKLSSFMANGTGVANNSFDLKGGNGSITFSVNLNKTVASNQNYEVHFKIDEIESGKNIADFIATTKSDGLLTYVVSGKDPQYKKLLPGKYNINAAVFHPGFVDGVQGPPLSIIDSGDFR